MTRLWYALLKHDNEPLIPYVSGRPNTSVSRVDVEKEDTAEDVKINVSGLRGKTDGPLEHFDAPSLVVYGCKKDVHEVFPLGAVTHNMSALVKECTELDVFDTVLEPSPDKGPWSLLIIRTPGTISFRSLLTVFDSDPKCRIRFVWCIYQHESIRNIA